MKKAFEKPTGFAGSSDLLSSSAHNGAPSAARIFSVDEMGRDDEL
jgi:hypothetical protein